MEAALQTKLDAVVELVNNVMVDPDVDLEYYLGGDTGEDPHIMAKYSEDNYRERRICLGKYLDKTAEDISNYVTFSIEQFKEEIDSLKHGAQ